jgi:hypothetical protein
MNNYRSNEKVERISVTDLSAIAQADDQEYGGGHAGVSHQDNQAINHLANDLALDDVDINLDDSDELENVNTREDKFHSALDPNLNTFDDFATSLDQAIGKTDNILPKKDKLEIEIKSNRQELDDIKNIFDKIDEFDNIFGTNSPDAGSPDQIKEGHEDDNATI